MAEEETKQDQIEGKDDMDGDGEESTLKKKPPKKVILIGAGVLVLAILGAVGYLVFAPSSQASPGEEGGEAVTAEGEEENGDSRSSRRSSQSSRRGGDEEAPSTDIYMTDFPSSVVNLGPSEKFDYVYLKYGFNLELGDEKVRAEIGKKMPKLVSVIDTAMSGHSWDKIGTARGRESLAKDVVRAMNAQLETGEVVACHFVTFVAQ
jgi:flagellar basal body-associated protein FliL